MVKAPLESTWSLAYKNGQPETISSGKAHDRVEEREEDRSDDQSKFCKLPQRLSGSWN